MRSEKTAFKKSHIVYHILLSVFLLFCIVPVLYIISISFSDEKALALYGYKLIPKVVSTYAYSYVMANSHQLLTSYKITILVTAIGTFFSLLITSMLAYVMSRKDLILSKLISFLVFFTMIFNIGLVPWYILIVRYYHIGNTLLALILPYIIVPWNVFLMKGFFADFPFALIEAAKIDGSSELSSFFRIVLPISKPALATVGLFIAFMYWNDWWLGILFIENQNLVPLQMMLYQIMNNIQYLATSVNTTAVHIDISNLPSESARMAICILAAGPMMVIFPFFQKYFVKGMTLGSVKG
jgi:putative aldouronate transport system permease protein